MDAAIKYTKNNKRGMISENKRNGYSKKTVKSQYGEFRVDIPRDREGSFEAQIIPKYQRDISAEMVSKITDKILPEVKEWQSRPLDSSKLQGAGKTAIGNRLVFDLTATYNNDKNKVTDFGSGKVAIFTTNHFSVYGIGYKESIIKTDY